MEEPNERPPGFLASLKGIWRTLLAIALNRLELLLVEAEEERRRAVEALVLALAGAVLGMMALIVGSFALVIACGEERRLTALVILTAIYAAGCAAVLWSLRRRMKKWQPFSATLAEFKKDKTWLEEKTR